MELVLPRLKTYLFQKHLGMLFVHPVVLSPPQSYLCILLCSCFLTGACLYMYVVLVCTRLWCLNHTASFPTAPGLLPLCKKHWQWVTNWSSLADIPSRPSYRRICSGPRWRRRPRQDCQSGICLPSTSESTWILTKILSFLGRSYTQGIDLICSQQKYARLSIRHRLKQAAWVISVSCIIYGPVFAAFFRNISLKPAYRFFYMHKWFGIVFCKCFFEVSKVTIESNLLQPHFASTLYSHFQSLCLCQNFTSTFHWNYCHILVLMQGNYSEALYLATDLTMDWFDTDTWDTGITTEMITINLAAVLCWFK